MKNDNEKENNAVRVAQPRAPAPVADAQLRRKPCRRGGESGLCGMVETEHTMGLNTKRLPYNDIVYPVVVSCHYSC